MAVTLSYKESSIQLEPQPTENDSTFAQRIEFYIHALLQGYSFDRCESLSYAWINKVIYKVEYPPAVEAEINKIALLLCKKHANLHHEV